MLSPTGLSAIVSGDNSGDVSISPAARLATESLSPISAYEVEASEMDRFEECFEKPEGHDEISQDEQTKTPLLTGGSSKSDSQPDEKDSEDSFVKQIKSRSPAKRVSRIEDSVEALDALEDEIEKAAEAIPAAKKPDKGQAGDTKTVKIRPSVGLKLEKDITKAHQKPRLPHQKENRPMREMGKNGNPTLSATPKVALKTKTPLAPVPSKQGERGSSSAVGKDQALKAKVAPSKRISSIHKAPFQPTKSTKPPTRSSFELPGEAISRKLKEQREERQKRESEEMEKAKTNTFKARPVPKTQAPQVKMTVTAKARLSISKHELLKDSSPTKPAARTRTGQSTINGSNTGTSKRLSSLALPKRGSADPKPNLTTTAKRSPSINPNIRRSSAGMAIARKAPSPEDIAQQKEKGRAVFARPKDEIAERERERREREEAAKKARMEAAERGRLASRQWAERQREKGMGKHLSDKAPS